MIRAARFLDMSRAAKLARFFLWVLKRASAGDRFFEFFSGPNRQTGRGGNRKSASAGGMKIRACLPLTHFSIHHF